MNLQTENFTNQELTILTFEFRADKSGLAFHIPQPSQLVSEGTLGFAVTAVRQVFAAVDDDAVDGARRYGMMPTLDVSWLGYFVLGSFALDLGNIINYVQKL